MASERREDRAGEGSSTALRAFKIVAWVIALAALLWLAAIQLRGGADRVASSFGVANYRAQAVAVDEPAPDFELPLLSGGGTLRLSDLRGRVVVLNFWASWCSPCRLAAIQLRGGADRVASSFGVANYRAQAVAVDEPAPDFELPLVSGGGTLRLSDLRSHVVVLNFWASWCSPCRLEARDLQAASVAYRARGVRFVGVDEVDDRFAARAFLEEFSITYPSVFDPSGSLADDYGFIGLPATYVIDERGTIAFRFQGFLDGPTLRSALDDVLAGGS